MPQGSAFCTSCGTSFAAPPPKTKSNLPIILAIGAAVVVGIAVALFFILRGDGAQALTPQEQIIGTWEFVASEELRNGILVDRWESESQGGIAIQFNQDGTGALMHGLGFESSFRWAISGNVLTITDQLGGDQESIEFRVSDHELRTINNRNEWWGDVWEEHSIYHRR